MASESTPEIGRVMLLIHNVGTKALLELLTDKLFHKFLEQNRPKIQHTMTKTDAERIYLQSGKVSPTAGIDNLEEPLLKKVITLGASDILKKHHVSIEHDRYDKLHKFLISTILTSVLEGLVDTKMKMKNLNSVQKGKLTSKPLEWQEFDISLLSRLLFDLFPSTKPTVNVENLPSSMDTKEGDDILRIKIHRNSLAHEEYEKIPADQAWNDVCEAIDRLGKSKFRDEVKQIKEKCMDKQMKDNCEKIVQLWKEDEHQWASDIAHLKEYTEERIEKQTEEVKDIIHQHVKSSTETIKKAIADYREQTKKTLETLMGRYTKELRSCMTREEGTAVQTENRVEKILENLQEEIKKHFFENVQKMTENIESKVTENLESGMNELRNFISTKNETFLESIKASMNNLGATLETATKGNEEKLQKYFENIQDMYEASAAKVSDTAKERDKEMKRLIENLKEEVTEKIEKKTATERAEASEAAKEREEKFMEMLKNLKEEVTEKVETKIATEITEDTVDSESDNSDVDRESRIKVTRLPERMTEEKLRSFFHSKSKSGGGPLEYIDFNKEKMQAVITFKDAKAMKRVLQRQPLSIDGKQISVEECVTDSETETEGEVDELDDCSCTIEVRGMKATTSSDALELYFESRKAAGIHVDIVNFRFIKSEMVARIKYASQKEMQKVLRRKHVIEGAELEVKKYTKEPEAVYKDKVLIRGVDLKSTKKKLAEFLISYASATPKNFADGKEEGVVLVTFEGLPDIEALIKTCVVVSFDGQFLQVFRLPVSKCVFVTGVGPSTEEDTLLYYFENRNRSGGGDITKINYNKNEGTCYVQFKDHTVADQVCTRQHTIDSHNLTTRIYHEMLETFSGAT